nr:hypothetical protein [Desulfobacula sp.]
ALQGKAFTVKNDLATNSVVIRTTDGSDITLDNVSTLVANPTIAVTALAGTTIPGDPTLTFDGADAVAANADTLDTDTFVFSGNGSGVTIREGSFAGGNKSGVITGTLTILVDSGMTLQSDVSGPGSGGIFAGINAKSGVRF